MKTNRLARTLFTTFVSLLMIITSFSSNPTLIYADPVTNAAATLDKTATPVPGKLNTWDMKLRVEVKPKTETTDVVLVIDRSGSMGSTVTGTGKTRMQLAKEAANNFIDSTMVNGVRIGLVSYAGGTTIESGFTTDKAHLKSKISNLVANEGTFTQQGLKVGHELLHTSPANHKILVLLSDGEPTYGYEPTYAYPNIESGSYSPIPGSTGTNSDLILTSDVETAFTFNNFNYNGARIGSGSSSYSRFSSGDRRHYNLAKTAIAEAGIAKGKGQTIFSIALGAGTLGEYSLKGIASKPEYYFQDAGNTLQAAFNAIALQIKQPMVGKIEVTDPMGPGFSLVPGSVVLSPDSSHTIAPVDQINWKIDKFQLDPNNSNKMFAEMKYQITTNANIVNEYTNLAQGAAPSFPTNGLTTFKYTPDVTNTVKYDYLFPIPKVTPTLVRVDKKLLNELGEVITDDLLDFKFSLNTAGQTNNGQVKASGHTYIWQVNPIGVYTLNETEVLNGHLDEFEVSYTKDGTLNLAYGSGLHEIGIINKLKKMSFTPTKSVTDANGNGLAEPGETLNYTITVENTGARIIRKLKVKDDLVNILSHIDDIAGITLDVGGTPALLSDLVSGIEVNIPVGETLNITFSVKVKGDLDVDAVVLLSNIALIGTIEKNAEIPTGAPKLSASKTVSDANGNGYAEPGEWLAYQIKIKNTGKVGASDVLVQDTLSQITDHIDDISTLMMSVDGVQRSLTDLVNGFNLNVDVNQTIDITFSVRVKTNLDPAVTPTLANTATVGELTPKTDIPTGAPNLVSSKTVQDRNDNGFAEAGEFLDYEITLKNHGNLYKNNVLIKDTLSDLLPHIKSIAGLQFKLDGVDRPIQDLIDGFNVNIAAGTTVQVKFTVQVKDDLNTQSIKSLRNTATVGEDTPGTTIPTGAPKLDIKKTVFDDNENGYAEAGETLSYEITVSNSGEVRAKDVLIKDDLALMFAHLGDISGENYEIDGVFYPLADLRSGITMDVDVDDPVIIKFKVTLKSDLNTKTVLKIDNKATANELKAETSTPTGAPKVYAAKTVIDQNGDGIAEPGELLTYTIKFGNTGEVATQSMLIQDTLPNLFEYVDLAGVVYDMGDGIDRDIINLMTGFTMALGPNDHRIITFTVKVNEDLDVNLVKSLSNLAVIGDETPETVIPTGAPKLVATKSVSDASGDMHAEAGEALTYTITVSNTGTVAKKGLEIQDTLSELLPHIKDISNTYYTMGSESHLLQKLIDGFTVDLGVGETATVVFTVVLKDDFDANEFKLLTNLATVGKDRPGTQIPTGVADLSASKTVEDETQDGIAQSNEKLTYTITIKNDGNVSKNEVFVQDTLSTLLPHIKDIGLVKFTMGSDVMPLQKLIDGFTIDIDKATTVVIQFTVEVMDNLDVETIKTLANMVTVGTLTPTTSIPTGKFILTSDKTVRDQNQNSYAEAGETLFYEIWVKNSGTVSARDVMIKDDLTDLMAYIDSPLGGTFTLNGVEYPMSELIEGKLITVDANSISRIRFSVSVKADMKVKDVEKLINIAIVGEDTPGTEIPTGEPDVYANKTVVDENEDGFAEAGELLTYTILFGNNGDVATQELLVQDTLSDLVGSVDLTSVMYDMGDGIDRDIINLMRGFNMTLGPNDHRFITFTVRVNEDLDLDLVKTLTNLAVVGDERPETEIPTGAPKLSSVKTVVDENENGFAEAGELLFYEITITNSGNVMARDVSIQDTLSDLLDHVDGLADVNLEIGETVQPIQNLMDGLEMDIMAGSQVTLRFTLKVNDDLDTDEIKILRNIAKVNEEEPEIEIPTGAPKVSSDKFVYDENEDGFAEPGELLTYEITTKNSGNVAQKDLFIQDTLSNLLDHVDDVGSLTFTMGDMTRPLQDLIDGFMIDLDVETSITIRFTLRVNDDLDTDLVQTLSNLAVVGEDRPETEIPTGAPELDSGKSVGDENGNGFAEAGETLFYEIWITNAGDVKSQEIIVKDDLASLMAYIESPLDGTYTLNGIEHPMSELMAGQSVIVDANSMMRIRFSVQVKADMLVKDIAVLKNIAMVGEDTPEAEIPTGEAKLSSIKIARDDNEDGFAQASEMMHYTILVMNQGNVSARDVMIKDDLALLKDHVEDLAGLMFDMDGTLYPLEDLMNGIKVDVAPDKIINISFSVTVKSNLDVKVVTVINNEAFVNDTPISTETPTEKPNLEVDKEVLDNNGDGIVFPNGTLTYSILIKNNAQSNAYNVKVRDKLNNILYAILDPSDNTLYQVYKGETSELKVKELMDGMLVDIDAGETLILYFEVSVKGELLENDILLNLVEVDNLSATATINLEIPLVEPAKLPKPAVPVKAKPALPATGISNRMVQNGIQMIAIGLVLMSIEAIRRKRQKDQ